MKKVLVTGGAGYLGSTMVPELLKNGFQVTVLDNFMYQQTSLLEVCHDKNLTIVRGDARDKELVQKLLKDKDIILPLACYTGAPLCKKDPVGAESTNYGAVKLINDLRSKNQIVIFPTTNSGYGIGEKGKFCTEETPMRPISLYGKWKVNIEEELLASENTATLRLATVFGVSPRMRLDLLVNDFTYRAVNDRFIVLFEAQFKRNFVHVRDIAAVFQHVIKNFDKMKGEPYNVGLTEANIDKMELCLEIKKKIPDFHIMESPIGEDPDKRDYVVSNEKIEKTGWEAKVGLSDGLDELIKGYQIIKRNQYANV